MRQTLLEKFSKQPGIVSAARMTLHLGTVDQNASMFYEHECPMPNLARVLF